MTLRRASLILPCRQLEELPTYLTGTPAAELLAAWTALWHPALIQVTGTLPGWHPADELPDPAALESELVVVPSVSRERMAPNWCDRLRATAPLNPPPVEAKASRRETVASVLAAASLDPSAVDPDVAGEFWALGHAHLQVELLTRALRYSSVLDTDRFTEAVVSAAAAAVTGQSKTMRDELSRAFDLLSDARNHVYSVDFYVVDLTLLAPSTLGESLRAKLATGSPTNLLLSGELIEQLAREHPETVAELKRVIEAGTATIVGGAYQSEWFAASSPEGLVAEISRGQEAARHHLGCEYQVFGQFGASFSPLLPEVLKGLGFRGALYAAFDGGRVPKADQCKTNWGPTVSASIEALAATPLDAARPETWLKLAERIGDTIAHDHVATILLAGWPGSECEYFDDLRRAARFAPALGKLLTLDEYFRSTREPDEWTTFNPREYAPRAGTDFGTNAISTRVDTFRRDALDVHQWLGAGLAAIAGLTVSGASDAPSDVGLAINPWNFPCTQYLGVDPLGYSQVANSDAALSSASTSCSLPDVPGCGYAIIERSASGASIALAEELTLRNERLELTVSRTTGGIQSLRTHRDRSTRVSQRLVFHDESTVSHTRRDNNEGGPPPLDTHMVADAVELTRNDSLMGEITSRGRLLDAHGELLAGYTQVVRAVRGLSAMIVQVELDPQRVLVGDIWKSYFASRLAIVDEPLSVRRGMQWTSSETTRECIESPEWLQLDDGVGKVTCYSLGLPFHRRAGPTWLDTLLLVAGEQPRGFQFAIGLDEEYPARTALSLLTSGQPCLAVMRRQPSSPRGWFLHVSAKNVLVSHIEPLPGPASGIRLRLLETEGRETETTVAAFKPFTTARISDFRGNELTVLSVVEGRIEISIGPHRFVQIEAEW
jgi:alpha-mannosidase